LPGAVYRRAIGAVRRIGVRRVRLATGLVLFAYVGTHLTDHALGNVSVAAMERGLLLQKWIWQGVLGTGALYLSLAVHFSLGLWALYRRRHWGWTAGEVLQLVLGLSIPPLLAHHLVVTRLDFALYGTQKGYAQELYSFWVAAPRWGVVQVALLSVAWIHGCLGVYFWLRLKPVFSRIGPVLLSLATLLPVLALLGFVQGGRAIAQAARSPAWRSVQLTSAHVGTPGENAWLSSLHARVLLALALALALVLAARAARRVTERLRGSIRLFYPNARVVRVPRGFSVLEGSLMAQVPHACICGGRARCSTCRVRVIGDKRGLPPPGEVEKSVLERVQAGPFVRLACQLRPLADVVVIPLVPPGISVAELRRQTVARGGEERFVAVIVADMRDSTQLALRRLPFDAVFAIGSFVDALGRAMIATGGQPNQFTGDGLLALFGTDCSPEKACRRVLEAVVRIAENVAALNEIFMLEWAEPIRFAIGIDGGEAVVGRVGYGENLVFTALGDPPNVASRLQHLCKTLGCEVLVSDAVCRLSGVFMDDLPRHSVALRGRDEPLAVRAVARAIDLAPRLDAVLAPYVVRRARSAGTERSR
jgi:adenylate cyclase